ncbi:hypothetical protein A2U01_0024883, partial [Trifolium medium]|nr:hypothetical protein [Trifolium medium]
SIIGAARPAVWRNAPCFSVLLVLFLVYAQRARVAGATRSLERIMVVLLLVAAQRAGVTCAACRAALFRAFWFLVLALRAG